MKTYFSVLFFILLSCSSYASDSAKENSISLNLNDFSHLTTVLVCGDDDCEEAALSSVDTKKMQAFALIEQDVDANKSKGKKPSHAFLIFAGSQFAASLLRTYSYDRTLFGMSELGRSGPKLARVLAKRLLLPIAVVTAGVSFGQLINHYESRFATFGGVYPEGLFTATGKFWGSALYNYLND